MRLTYHPAAEAELNEAIMFYANRAPGLGERFLQEFDATTAAIQATPNLWPVISADLRCLTMRRFPFAVYYRINGEELRVIVIKHHNQRSDFWHDRLDEMPPA